MKKLIKRFKKLKKSISLKRISINTLTSLLILMSAAHMAKHKSDQYIFNRVIQLQSMMGTCSGEQVRAPSGHDYILTAAHCRPLVEGGKIIAEDKSEHPAIFIAEDPKSDLMLLAGISGMKGLSIADSAKDREEVRTFTHGAGMKAYKTSGALIESQEVKVLLGLIAGDEDMLKCTSMPKYEVFYIYGIIPACILSVQETVSTAVTVPGSSGGAVVDANGDIVGVVSAGDGKFSFFVQLSDIQAFLADK
jgi:hypothetical protein